VTVWAWAMVWALRQRLGADLPQSHRRSSPAMPPKLRRETADRSNVDVSYTIPLGKVDMRSGVRVATASYCADNVVAGYFLRSRARISWKPTFVDQQTNDGIVPRLCKNAGICNGSLAFREVFVARQRRAWRPCRGDPRSGWMARFCRTGPSVQYNAVAAAAVMPRAQPGRERLASVDLG